MRASAHYGTGNENGAGIASSAHVDSIAMPAYAGMTATIPIRLGSTITISSPSRKYSKPRHLGSISMIEGLDGMASLLPLGISLVVIFGKSELLVTPERWEAAVLLLCIAATDLFGGYAINIALSRRMMDVAGPIPA
jgi:hypothetical protein